MNAPTDTVQILRDSAGHPAFAVLPFAQYQHLVKTRTHVPLKQELGIPAPVVENAIRHGLSATHAWREHLQLTQAQVAKRMGITQGAYAQLESKTSIRASSRVKVAQALGIDASQLDF
jgi:DNA-binding XRE family transcriptional regulator